MSKHILALGFISAIAVACTLSVSDINPKPVSLFGSSGVGDGASISNGSLTINGSSLNNVMTMAIEQSNQKVDMPIESRTSSVLRATLPGALVLPAMLFISTAHGEEAPISLSALSALSISGSLAVSGTASVTGTLALGYFRAQRVCLGAGSCTVDCPDPAAQVVMGGGCTINPDTIGTSQSYPISTFQWTCKPSAPVTGPVAQSVAAYALCSRIKED